MEGHAQTFQRVAYNMHMDQHAFLFDGRVITMRFLSLWMGLMVAISVSACDLWPKELDSLAESIT